MIRMRVTTLISLSGARKKKSRTVGVGASFCPGLLRCGGSQAGEDARLRCFKTYIAALSACGFHRATQTGKTPEVCPCLCQL